MPSESELKRIVAAAISKVKSDDADLFRYDVYEIAVAHRLARYLEDELLAIGERWSVDLEYNRMGAGKTKKYRGNKLLRPDIVIHRRGLTRQSDNLLVIELKKAGNPDGVAEDHEKLDDAVRGVGVFHYQFGLYLTFDPRGDFDPEWAGPTELVAPIATPG